MSFNKLLEKLQAVDATQAVTLAKSLPAAQDDKNIQAAAEKSTANNGEGAGAGSGEGEGEGENKGEGAGEGEDLTKSLPVVEGADGDQMIDATEVLETLQKSMNSTNEALNTGFPLMISMMERMGNTIAAQGELIKSLQQNQINAGAQGAGRKSQVVVMAKSVAGAQAAGAGAGADGHAEQMSGEELMIKSNAAYTAGKITGIELNLMDMAVNRGVGTLDMALVNRIVGAKL